MTTKAQEREILKKIEKIMSPLEEDSYIKTAFKGIIEDAWRNIEDDFAICKADELEQTQKLLDEAKAERDRLQAKIERTESLSRDQLHTILFVVRQREREEMDKVKQAEADILQYAETPDCPEFRKAVNIRKYASEKVEMMRALDDPICHEMDARY